MGTATRSRSIRRPHGHAVGDADRHDQRHRRGAHRGVVPDVEPVRRGRHPRQRGHVRRRPRARAPPSTESTRSGISDVPLTAVSCPASGTACAAVDNHSQEIGFTPRRHRHAHPRPIASPSLSGHRVPEPHPVHGDRIRQQRGDVRSRRRARSIAPACRRSIPPDNALTGIACVSTAECTAVDGGGNEITFNPTTGQQNSGGLLLPEALPATSVACQIVLRLPASAPRSTRSGDQVTFYPDPPTPEHRPQLASPGGPRAPLQSVACPAADQCTAVDATGDEVTFNPTLPSASPLLRAPSTPAAAIRS